MNYNCNLHLQRFLPHYGKSRLLLCSLPAQVSGHAAGDAVRRQYSSPFVADKINLPIFIKPFLVISKLTQNHANTTVIIEQIRDLYRHFAPRHDGVFLKQRKSFIPEMILFGWTDNPPGSQIFSVVTQQNHKEMSFCVVLWHFGDML